MNVITVRDLIALLEELPQDVPMIISVDEEGNELRMLNGVGPRYVEELRYRCMDALDEEELDEYDRWVLTAEIW